MNTLFTKCISENYEFPRVEDFSITVNPRKLQLDPTQEIHSIIIAKISGSLLNTWDSWRGFTNHNCNLKSIAP
ncbi:hypothetical protein Fmac_024458 [Flemingia macrophylla]|uniref:Uncharacterized protein n=1 Tax=Flemingia macrophylla TaxID=520843 RepID=A0ABD1LR70_9FABA